MTDMRDQRVSAWVESPSPLRLHVKLAATIAMRPLTHLAAGRLDRSKPLLLHLGCGPRRLEGWINADLAGRQKIDLALDARKRLPFPAGSLDAIFSEHLLEHLDYDEAERLLRECARVLKPGGVVRIVVPDFGRYAADYAGADGGLIARVRPCRPTKLVALAEVAYSYGHRSLWDGETLTLAMSGAGLNAQVAAFGQSLLDPCPDNEERRDESLYVEARRLEA